MSKTFSIVCPASAGSEKDFRLCDEFFESVKFGENSRNSNFDMGGSDQERADDLMNAFAEESDAILAMRGGYGSARLLDKIDYEKLKENPKPFFGYSDITAFQLALWHKSAIPSYSGFMPGVDLRPANFSETTISCFEKIVNNQQLDKIENLNVVKEGKAEGVLLGGCLSVITSMIGSDYLPDFTGAILFVEDVNEPPYCVDRMLLQLYHAGILTKLSGLIFGAFTKSFRINHKLTLEAVIADYAPLINGPVMTELPYGHIQHKVIMPIGKKAVLSSETKSLSFI